MARAVLPRWLEKMLILAWTGILAFALSAMPLAMFELFRPVPVITLAAAVWIVLLRIWGRDDSSVLAATHRAAAAVLVVVLVATGINVRFAAQNLFTSRDPGVYNTTARWLANQGTLLIDPDDDVYKGAGVADRVRLPAAGFYMRDDRKMYPQFMHLLPAILGASSWIVGSRGMLKVSPLLGGLALLLFFAAALAILRPWWAVLATAALSVNLVQVHFSRDSYSELLSQVFIFGGLFGIQSAWNKLSPRRALVAGLSFGALPMARIDGWVLFVPLAAWMTCEWIARRNGVPRTKVALLLCALASGAAVPAVIGWFDARYFTTAYWNGFWPSLLRVWWSLIAIAVGGALLVGIRRWVPSWVTWIRVRRRLWATIAVLALVMGAAYAFLLRPHLGQVLQTKSNVVVEAIQMRDGVPVEGRRTYAEFSLRWIGMYVGIPALALGVLGYALMWRDLLLGRLRHALLFLLMFLVPSALYLWSPHITPDHLWAMRRFLPLTIPGLLLCFVWVLERIADWRPSLGRLQRRRVASSLVATAAVSTIVFEAWTLAPVVTERPRLGLLHATQQLCRVLPEDGAVLVAQGQRVDRSYQQTVRSFCGVPVASGPVDEPLEWYRDLAGRWAAKGRTMWLLSETLPFGPDAPPSETIPIAELEVRELDMVLNGRPREFILSRFRLFLTEVKA